MLTLLKSYHRYLTEVAQQGQDIAGRQIGFSLQITPWIGPLTLGLALLYLLDPHGRFDEARSLAVFLPFAAVSFAGVCYVAVVFTSVGIRQTLQGAEARKQSERSPWGPGPGTRMGGTPSSQGGHPSRTWLSVSIVTAVLIVGVASYLAYGFFLTHP